MLDEAHAPAGGLLHQLADGDHQRRSLRDQREEEDGDVDRGATGFVVVAGVLEGLQAVHEGDTAAEEEDPDRGDQGPDEGLPAVPRGVCLVRRTLGAGHAHREQDLVAHVCGGVDALGEHFGIMFGPF